ncbi:hypothetical protein A9Q99_06525 [Gammaproteobacteria bacterium 45_16_T64]|nr:hypothetical protein A9Q99_06525 [Gammaproteobacteria bacterium 45_16_T64]
MNPNDARASRSRRALLDASLELLLQKPTASLSEVAAHAGVGRATLYRHFDTRDKLVCAITLDSLGAIQSVVQPILDEELSAEATLTRIIGAIVPLANQYHFLLSLWNIGADDPQVMEIYNQQLASLFELVERGKSEGWIKPSLNSRWIVTTIDSLIYSAWWMLGQGEMTEDEVTTHILDTLFSGITKK